MMERLIYISFIEDIISTYLWVWSLGSVRYGCFLRPREKKKIP